ncbi:uncharacterized protein LOC109612802 [Musca domestica]|uniref:Uncharacterized protein LOC109612802 n=1 Tax=Musca domestica TaxID=7370 RepID=A0A9J7IDG4_MUSDO|nr:uncharacterized protein LOC109612802 [Musca domestica]
MWSRGTVLVLLLIHLTQVPVMELKKTENYKSINFVTSETTTDKLYVREYRMDIRKDRRIADIFVEVGQQVPMNVTLLVTLKLQISAKDPERQQRSPTMFQVEFKYCELLSKKNARLSGFLLPFLKKSFAKSQFPKRCPIEAGNYSLIGLNLEDLKIPTFLPTSQYDVTVYGFIPRKTNKEVLVGLHLLTEIK